jgi:hypothetical protein
MEELWGLIMAPHHVRSARVDGRTRCSKRAVHTTPVPHGSPAILVVDFCPGRDVLSETSTRHRPIHQGTRGYPSGHIRHVTKSKPVNCSYLLPDLWDGYMGYWLRHPHNIRAPLIGLGMGLWFLEGQRSVGDGLTGEGPAASTRVPDPSLRQTFILVTIILDGDLPQRVPRSFMAPQHSGDPVPRG